MIVGAVAVVAALCVGASRYYKVPFLSLFSFGAKAPVLAPTPTPSPPAGGSEPTTESASAISKTKTSENSFLYVLYGSFPSGVNSQGDSLRGAFVAENDPNKAAVDVTIVPTDGKINLGISKTTLRGETTWAPISPTETATKIAAGAPAQIWWVPENGADAIAQRLDQAAGGGWTALTGLQLTVKSVGILEK